MLGATRRSEAGEGRDCVRRPSRPDFSGHGSARLAGVVGRFPPATCSVWRSEEDPRSAARYKPSESSFDCMRGATLETFASRRGESTDNEDRGAARVSELVKTTVKTAYFGGRFEVNR